MAESAKKESDDDFMDTDYWQYCTDMETETEIDMETNTEIDKANKKGKAKWLDGRDFVIIALIGVIGVLTTELIN